MWLCVEACSPADEPAQAALWPMETRIRHDHTDSPAGSKLELLTHGDHSTSTRLAMQNLPRSQDMEVSTDC